MTQQTESTVAELRGSAEDMRLLLHGDHHEPHRVLGVHPATVGGRAGVIVRAFHPDAKRAECLLSRDSTLQMVALGHGMFAAFVPGASLPLAYRLRFHFADGNRWERGDPYRFMPLLGDLDLHLIAEGTHRQLWKVLGANLCTVDGEKGTSFAVWAPNARRVSIIADFNGWDGRLLPMRSLGGSGVWELFVPGIPA